MNRELGVETAPCFECGKQRPTEERPDGSRAAILCDGHSCDVVETASTPPSLPREFGLNPDEVVYLDDEEENDGE